MIAVTLKVTTDCIVPLTLHHSRDVRVYFPPAADHSIPGNSKMTLKVSKLTILKKYYGQISSKMSANTTRTCRASLRLQNWLHIKSQQDIRTLYKAFIYAQ